MRVPIDQIKPSPYAPRCGPRQPVPIEAQERILGLAASIREYGQLQPIKVRPRDGGYECVFGHRRLWAVQEAGLEEIEAIVQDLDDRQARLQIWEENEEREDLDDVARAKFLAAYQEEYGLSSRQMVPIFGLGKSQINYLLALLDEPQEIQDAVASGLATTASVSKVREILGDDTEARRAIIREVAETEVGRDEATRRARAVKYQKRTSKFKKKDEDWQESPTVKEATEDIAWFRGRVHQHMTSMKVGKMAPEAERFIANKLKHLIRLLEEWEGELDG